MIWLAKIIHLKTPGYSEFYFRFDSICYFYLMRTNTPHSNDTFFQYSHSSLAQISVERSDF